jgi:hypothetical protein
MELLQRVAELEGFTRKQPPRNRIDEKLNLETKSARV